MEELVKYFEGLEGRIATLENQLANLEAELNELKNRPAPEPQVIEKEVIKEIPVEVIKEVVVEKPVEVIKEVEVEPSAVSIQPSEEPKPVMEKSEPVVEPEPVVEEPQPEPVVEEPVVEEQASPKAAIYGKAVDDIRQAISLGDRFLFQRELFGQNAELMQRTMIELNALNSFDEAIDYISSNFQWDTESNTYQQFLVTLHRRFG